MTPAGSSHKCSRKSRRSADRRSKGGSWNRDGIKITEKSAFTQILEYNGLIICTGISSNCSVVGTARTISGKVHIKNQALLAN